MPHVYENMATSVILAIFVAMLAFPFHSLSNWLLCIIFSPSDVTPIQVVDFPDGEITKEESAGLNLVAPVSSGECGSFGYSFDNNGESVEGNSKFNSKVNAMSNGTDSHVAADTEKRLLRTLLKASKKLQPAELHLFIENWGLVIDERKHYENKLKKHSHINSTAIRPIKDISPTDSTFTKSPNLHTRNTLFLSDHEGDNASTYSTDSDNVIEINGVSISKNIKIDLNRSLDLACIVLVDIHLAQARLGSKRISSPFFESFCDKKIIQLLALDILSDVDGSIVFSKLNRDFPRVNIEPPPVKMIALAYKY